MRRTEHAPTGELLSIPATELARRFVQRTDVYARQCADGRYTCVHSPLPLDAVRAHLRGHMSLGVYVLDVEQRTRFVVLDADDDAGWQLLLAAAQDLARQGATAYCETSRRGGHLWLFFDTALAAEDARRFGRGLLRHYGATALELFPKQDRLVGGPGSLIRLPFGIHRKSGRRYGFVTPDGQPLAPTVRAQISCLNAAQSVPNRLLAHYTQLALPTRPPADFAGVERTTGALSTRIKAAVSVHDFVGHFVELSPTGVGLCPFHDDHVASFSVNARENYWHCFACRRGGSVIDFWMCYRDCAFIQAVRELAALLHL